MKTMEINLYGKRVTVLDEPVGRYVFTGCNKGNWKPELFQVFDRFLEPGMVYVNIGAFVGATTLYPALMGCECYAFECDHEAYRVLVENIRLNPDAALNIQAVMSCAISDHNGPGALEARAEFGSSTSRLAGEEQTRPQIPITCMTLDMAFKVLCLARCDFLKVNVQGAEPAILRAADSLLETLRPTLHVYIRPANWRKVPRDPEMLATVLSLYRNVYTEQGERVAPEIICTPDWRAKHDYKLVATDREWT